LTWYLALARVRPVFELRVFPQQPLPSMGNPVRDSRARHTQPGPAPKDYGQRALRAGCRLRANPAA
jgi:hypothetical protein